jgi:hypothetical protein
MRLFHFLAPAVAALGIAFGVTATSAKAADETPKTGGGTITGSVVDKDGKPVEGAKIRVMKPRQPGQGGPGGAGGGRGGNRPPQQQVADDPKPGDKPGDAKPGDGAGPGGPGAGRGGRQQQPPVAEATSDKDGKFKIEHVPAGDYQVITMVDGKGFGRARVTVKDNESAEAKLTLGDMPQRGQGGAGGGQGGNRRRPGGNAQ